MQSNCSPRLCFHLCIVLSFPDSLVGSHVFLMESGRDTLSSLAVTSQCIASTDFGLHKIAQRRIPHSPLMMRVHKHGLYDGRVQERHDVIYM
jgi:hypothetical protein